MSRPRQPELDGRLLRATVRLLDEVGYSALTMEAVASAAGVSKPTLYRRWSSKAALVFGATVEASLPLELPDTGSFAGDLRAAVAALADSLEAPERAVLGEQLGAMVADADFAAEVRRRLTEAQLDRISAIWDRAVERGEVEPDVDGVELLRDVSSSLVMRRLVYHLPLTDEVLDALVARTCHGCLRST